MATRNSRVLRRIIKALGISPQKHVLARLEEEFANELLLVAGTTQRVAEYARELRFDITPTEHHAALDYIARKKLLHLNIDDVEAAMTALFEDRFIEP
jgi:hypothetical protein